MLERQSEVSLPPKNSLTYNNRQFSRCSTVVSTVSIVSSVSGVSDVSIVAYIYQSHTSSQQPGGTSFRFKRFSSASLQQINIQLRVTSANSERPDVVSTPAPLDPAPLAPAPLDPAMEAN